MKRACRKFQTIWKNNEREKKGDKNVLSVAFFKNIQGFYSQQFSKLITKLVNIWLCWLWNSMKQSFQITIVCGKNVRQSEDKICKWLVELQHFATKLGFNLWNSKIIKHNSKNKIPGYLSRMQQTVQFCRLPFIFNYFFQIVCHFWDTRNIYIYLYSGSEKCSYAYDFHWNMTLSIN